MRSNAAERFWTTMPPLPFLKKSKDTASVSMPIDTIQRKPDEESAEFDGLDAVADDLLSAVKSGDRQLLKSALQSLVTHIQSEDMQQDQAMSGESP